MNRYFGFMFLICCNKEMGFLGQSNMLVNGVLPKHNITDFLFIQGDWEMEYYGIFDLQQLPRIMATITVALN